MRRRTFMWVLAASMLAASVSAEQGSVSDIGISFRLDPRVTRSLHLGDRWVSPPTYVARQDGMSITIDVRARPRDASGREVPSGVTWSPSDPEMVSVNVPEGPTVQITVFRAGESRLVVTSGGVSKELTIKAVSQQNVMQVEISPRR